MDKFIDQILENVFYWLPALIGGIVDYFNQIQRGDKKWSYIGFFIHLLSAVFFGWLVGLAANGFGYNANLVGAAGGMGGFLGVRIADLLTYRLMNVDRRSDKE